MQDLNDTMTTYMENAGSTDLLELSKRWAAYCLDHHCGKTLDCGLDISKALANFHYEIKAPIA